MKFVKSAIRKYIPSKPRKTWASSQSYELSHSIGFMNSEWFKSSIADFKAGRQDAATGFVDQLPFREFFKSDLALWTAFKEATTGKIGVDIGPSCWSPIANWSFLSKRIADRKSTRLNSSHI